MINLVLFRNDLRIHDNEVLRIASKLSGCVLPVFCFDPLQVDVKYLYGIRTAPVEPSTYVGGFPKCGVYRSRFLLESVKDLSAKSPLIVAAGNPELFLRDIVEKYGTEEEHVQKMIELEMDKLTVKTTPVLGQTLIHENDFPLSVNEVPDTFTHFRKIIETNCTVRPLIDSDHIDFSVDTTLKQTLEGFLKAHPDYFPAGDLHHVPVPPENSIPDKRGIYTPGGETAGIARAVTYIIRTDGAAKYKETRNGLVGMDFSTKFSPYLAFGCLSPRRIYHLLKQLKETTPRQQGSYWIYFELLWRDYFKFIGMTYGSQLFHVNGLRETRYLNDQWTSDILKFKLFAEGKTGIPIIDAGMRELVQTGFSSNRMRQNLASFLVHSLKVDWRLGACFFESILVDYDVHSNYGNWQYLAGVGNDPRENRKFNVIKQAHDYDPDGTYVKLWCPELSQYPDGSQELFMPWKKNVEGWPAPIAKENEWESQANRSNKKV